MSYASIEKPDTEICEALQKKIDLKTKPLGALGRLEEVALQVGTIQNTTSPEFTKPQVLVFAGDHGIAKEGVSPFPQEVTHQMVLNFVGGGAAINVFCEQHNLDLKVIDAGVNFTFPSDLPVLDLKVDFGTQSFLEDPAMTAEQCQEAMQKGAILINDIAENGSNVVVFGEMGIGNTSSSALLMHFICGLPLDVCIGKGTGHDADGMRKKKEILTKSADNYKGDGSALDLLAHFGGFETAMICGALLEAAAQKMTILVDGFNITAALLCAYKINANVKDYCISAHQSNEKGHKMMLDFLGLDPLLNIGLRLGEGTGGAVAYPLVQSSLLFLNKMASFEDAGVSNKE